jgi:hypothetical protein
MGCDVEIIGSARDDIAADTQPIDRRVDRVKVKSGRAVLHPRHNQQIKVTVRRMATFGTAAEQPNSPGIERTDKPAYDFVERPIL